jgi:vacuolar-type H+-ATPase subunit E/Vma4
MELQLTAQEQALLVTFLRERQRELLHEIARADLHDFRRVLQEREVILESLLRKLASEAVITPAA